MKLLKIILLLIFFITYMKSYTCDCIPKTFQESIENSKTILLGQVVKQEIKWIEYDEGLNFDIQPDSCCFAKNKKFSHCHPQVVFYIKVLKYFKKETNIDTILVYHHENSDCFPYTLLTGHKYLLYLNKDIKADIYGLSFFSYISICSRITNFPCCNYIDISANERVNEYDYIEKMFNKIKN